MVGPGHKAYPTAILSEIFLIVSHSSLDETRLDVDDTVFLKPNPNQQQYKLTSVCKHWREAALSTPALWSHIEIDLGPTELTSYFKERDREQQQKHFRLVLTWLQRSGTVPLVLYLHLHDRRFTTDLPVELVQTIDRWQILHVRQDQSPEPIQAFLDMLRDKASCLERLDLRSYCIRPEATIRLEDFPTLRHLGCRSNIAMVPGESSPLTSLGGMYWSFKELGETIPSFPSLTSLRLEVKSSVIPPNAAVITVPLTTLDIGGNPRYLGPFLSKLNLPAIRIAKISADIDLSGTTLTGSSPPLEVEELDEKYFSQLPSIFRRISSTLTELHLLGGSIDDFTAINLVAKIPNLAILSLQLNSLSDQSLKALSWKGAKSVCPKLRRLCIITDEPSIITVPCLIKMVESRIAHKPTMKIEMNIGVASEEDEGWDEEEGGNGTLEDNEEIQSLVERKKGAFKLTVDQLYEHDVHGWIRP